MYARLKSYLTASIDVDQLVNGTVCESKSHSCAGYILNSTIEGIYEKRKVVRLQTKNNIQLTINLS